jgi:hypothetical protein
VPLDQPPHFGLVLLALQRFLARPLFYRLLVELLELIHRHLVARQMLFQHRVLLLLHLLLKLLFFAPALVRLLVEIFLGLFRVGGGESTCYNDNIRDKCVGERGAIAPRLTATASSFSLTGRLRPTPHHSTTRRLHVD